MGNLDSAGLSLWRRRARMPSEQAVDDRQSGIRETARSRGSGGQRRPAGSARPARTARRIGEYRPDGGGDQHHPGDSADPEEHEVRDGPPRVLDQSEDEQRNRRRAGEAMDEANEQGVGGPGRSRDRRAAGLATLPASVVDARAAPIRAKVAMDISPWLVQVRMEAPPPPKGRNPADLLEEPCQVPHAEHDQHKGDGHFHRRGRAAAGSRL